MLPDSPPTAFAKLRLAVSIFVKDVGKGVFTITHSGLAMLGLVVVLGVGVALFRPDILAQTESAAYEWLRSRQFSLWWEPQNTAERATATDLKDIPSKQAAVAAWLASKYRVAPEPIAALVAEAYELSSSTKIKPHLILSVMAIESSFHPYIQSPAGAQGLMQVMTDIHVKKYEKYGGKLAAFDPLTNMRVGTQVLQEYIRLKGGVTEDGLLFYLGGDTLQSDTGYVAKVLAEQARLDQVAAGQKVSTQP
jgi:soluble lytic murein transglycosylase-like protein